VSRVNPPNTTIPNTDAADPRSQYATVFEELTGKKCLCLLVDLAFAPASWAIIFPRLFFDIVWLKLPNGDTLFAAFSGRAAAELLNRML